MSDPLALLDTLDGLRAAWLRAAACADDLAGFTRVAELTRKIADAVERGAHNKVTP